MLCNHCNQNPAVMHYVTVINGRKQEMDLCVECAQKKGIASFSPFSFSDFFTHTAKETPAQGGAACTVCGTTVSEMKKSGLVGCAHCYVDLIRGIDPILRSVQKNTRHVGRTPMGFASGNLPKPGDTVKDAPVPKSREEIMKEKLQQAIAEERFEEAAKLRDELRALKGGGVL